MSGRERLVGWRWLLLMGLLALAVPQAPAQESASEARMRKDLFYLAGEECQGRGTGTPGIDKAADYIAAEFKKAGLKPGNGDSYFQPFVVSKGSAKLAGPGVLALKGPQGQRIELAADKDFWVPGLSGSGKLTDAPVVFAGFGLTAPDAKYDDFKDLDVKGKVVVILRRTPRFESKPAVFTSAQASLESKVTAAHANKAAAVLLVNDATTNAKDDKVTAFASTANSANPATVPVLLVQRATIDRLLQSGLGTGLDEVEQGINRELKPASGVLKGWTVSLETKVERNAVMAKNVIGVLEGKGPLANETVVVGAHYDHLGTGKYFGSLAKGADRNKVHYGADDNGSGTTAVIELARRFASMKDRQGRRMVFMTFSGEELGLLGSRHYCTKEPLFPLKDTVFMLNLDMVGRMHHDKTIKKDVLVCEGVKSAEGFDELADKFTAGYNFDLYKRPGNVGYSDHYSFYQQGVPVLFYWTDTHTEYHRPVDTPDKINYAGMKKVVDVSEATLKYFATTAERAKWVKMNFTEPPSKGPLLGFNPIGKFNLASYDNNGVIIQNVAPKGPAAVAGLQGNDRIILLAGREIRNTENLTRVLEGLKAGETYDLVAVRQGKEMSFKVTPQMKAK